jgi:hypothetical protein
MTTAATTRIAELEAELAYNCARTDISSFCNGTVQSGKQWWVAKVPPCPRRPEMQRLEQVHVDRAIEYLGLIGLLERHPRQPWIHVKERAER